MEKCWADLRKLYSDCPKTFLMSPTILGALLGEKENNII
jgi:hypothetical protein